MKAVVGDRIEFDQSDLYATGVIVNERHDDVTVLLDPEFAGCGHDGDLGIEDSRGWFVSYTNIIQILDRHDDGSQTEISSEALEGILDG